MNGNYQLGDRVLGNWKLVRTLGQGSYGTVYEAEREDFGAVYRSAVKIITIPGSRSEIQSARSEGMTVDEVTAYFRGFVEELTREFALMSRLKGTANVVSYEDHVVVPHEREIGWDIIIRMELLTPLTERMEQRDMTAADVEKLGIDLCHALELCERLNIVHRDIKPENIFISSLGDYKLGDFGIARTVEKTGGGLSRKGTDSYMAPEVYKGEAYGSNVDLYSLGVVLYRLFNDNRLPFLPPYPAKITHSDREAALARRMSGEILPDPAHANTRMAAVIRRACAYDPKERYQTAAEMRTDLEAALSDETMRHEVVFAGRTLTGTEQSWKQGADRTESAFRAAPPVGEKPSARPEPDWTHGVFSGKGKAGAKKDPAREESEQQASSGAEQATVPREESETGKPASVGKERTPISPGFVWKSSRKPAGKSSKKTGLFLGMAALAVVLIVVLVIALGGGNPSPLPGDGASSSLSNQGVATEGEDPTWQTDPAEAVLWGAYQAEGYNGDEEESRVDFSANVGKKAFQYQGAEYEITTMPMEVVFGRLGFFASASLTQDWQDSVRETIIAESGVDAYTSLLSAANANYAELVLTDEAGSYNRLGVLYTVEDSTVSFYLFTFDETTYEITVGDKVMELQFTFDGRNLILFDGESILSYVPGDYTEAAIANGYMAYADAYVQNEEDAYGNLVGISYFEDHEDGGKSVYLRFADGTYPIDPTADFREDGTFTIRWQERYEKQGGQVERVEDPTEISGDYLYGGWCGLLLRIDGTIYRYQYSEEEYLSARLSGAADDVAFQDMDASTVDMFLYTQSRIREELENALSGAGIDVEVDAGTGEVTMDAAALFDADSDALSDTGTVLLDSFLDACTPVIESFLSEDTVSRLVIEGHTAPSESYEDGMDLSQRRAQSVAEYFAAHVPSLAGTMEPRGCSFGDPVIDADGQVDAAASSRIVIRFLLHAAF